MARLREIVQPFFDSVVLFKFPANVYLVSISDHSLMNVLLAFSKFHRSSILNHQLQAR